MTRRAILVIQGLSFLRHSSSELRHSALGRCALSVHSEEPLREEHSDRHRGHEDDGFNSEGAEIGEALEIPPGTVRSRIARGRAQLVSLLGYGNHPEPFERPTATP